MSRLVFALLLLTAPVAAHSAPLQPDPPISCEFCDVWNAAHEPFRVFGETYYVGVAGLSSVLIAGDSGLILLDGGLPQSAARIEQNLRALGFRVEDLRLIVNSHAHYDHAGGIAALQRASGATVASSAAGARALERGEPTEDDPQFGFGPQANRFPRIEQVRAVADGEVLRVGDLAITAHLTPGHTAGSTTWTWRACESARCLDVVYGDSLNPVSAPGFRFTGDPTRGMPSLLDSFRQSIAAVGRLPCDILLPVHPGFARLDEKLAARGAQPRPSADPFVDGDSCRAYAADAAKRLDARVAQEQREKNRKLEPGGKGWP